MERVDIVRITTKATNMLVTNRRCDGLMIEWIDHCQYLIERTDCSMWMRRCVFFLDDNCYGLMKKTKRSSHCSSVRQMIDGVIGLVLLLFGLARVDQAGHAGGRSHSLGLASDGGSIGDRLSGMKVVCFENRLDAIQQRSSGGNPTCWWEGTFIQSVSPTSFTAYRHLLLIILRQTASAAATTTTRTPTSRQG